jgi:hypothetical protein
MSEKKIKPVTEVILRSYPKVIFLYPLLITSFFLWLLQIFFAPIDWFGYAWLIVFFVNVFIMAFDFSSGKFFALVLIAVVLILLVVFLVIPNIPAEPIENWINFGLTWQFYSIITIILAFILGLVFIGTRFDYWKIERNEVYHKSGIFTTAERLPTKSLRIKKEIPDVFEFFILRAGSITLMPGGGDVIPLKTVLNINKKQEQIDWLLSHVSMESDELDSA